ncbi:MAG: DUF2726 domain-containing protein [Phycisphaerales bacterium]|nr:DUF2726 domain-containing protein [Phycisphaerales bacterium]
MNSIGLIALLAAGFVVVLVGLAIVAMVIGMPLSKLMREEAAKPNQKGRVDVSVYEQCDSFLSDAELNFYRVLVKVLAHPTDPHGAPQAVVMSKVRVPDLIQVKKGLDRSAWRSAFNRIKSKHVDFAICHPVTMQVLCGIELDDKSHNRADRQQRDTLMDAIYTAAGLPIVHVNCRRAYSIQEVGGMIREAVGR